MNEGDLFIQSQHVEIVTHKVKYLETNIIAHIFLVDLGRQMLRMICWGWGLSSKVSIFKLLVGLGQRKSQIKALLNPRKLQGEKVIK